MGACLIAMAAGFPIVASDCVVEEGTPEVLGHLWGTVRAQVMTIGVSLLVLFALSL